MNNIRKLKLVNVRLCSTFQNPVQNGCVSSSVLLRPGHHGNRQRCFSLQSTIESVAKTQSGIFKALSESTPVEYAQKLLLTVHDSTGLPWWATIVCTTVLLRSCITVPLALYQYYVMAKLENIQAEMGHIATDLKKEVAIAVKMYSWDEKTARFNYQRSIKKQYNNLIVRDNCHPFKTSLLFWFQIPLWVSVSVSLRNLVYQLPHRDVDAQLTFAELSVGGFGWIPNLVEVDSSLILPVAFGLLNLAIIEIQALSKVRAPTKFQVYLTNFFRGFSVVMVPIAASVPSCVVLYWTTSSAFGLVQNLVLMSPRVKRTFNIPRTASELEQPYQYLVANLKQKLKTLPGAKIS